MGCGAAGFVAGAAGFVAGCCLGVPGCLFWVVDGEEVIFVWEAERGAGQGWGGWLGLVFLFLALGVEVFEGVVDGFEDELGSLVVEEAGGEAGGDQGEGLLDAGAVVERGQVEGVVEDDFEVGVDLVGVLAAEVAVVLGEGAAAAAVGVAEEALVGGGGGVEEFVVLGHGGVLVLRDQLSVIRCQFCPRG